MPTSSSAATFEKRKSFRSNASAKSVEKNENNNEERSDSFLTIESALPLSNQYKKLTKRSYSTLNAASLAKVQNKTLYNDPITVQFDTDGSIHVLRTQNEKETNPDRICLDRRGLNLFPLIDGEIKLRLLSLQHNLITDLNGLMSQHFPYLVFLDVYDNQLEHLSCLDTLENLRVLLLGKNRLRKIEGLTTLKKIEVLDLHGNQISQITGLNTLSELKVLNLAGNQLRYIGSGDFEGLIALQELNLRRNKLKKLIGFGGTPNLSKLFISNNDLQNVEDISSLAKATNLKEISIDNNPVSLTSDCTNFLISYLPHLVKLNTMQITDQMRKPAAAWRRNIELTNSAFMNLTSDVCLNVRREEIISNARTNWELIRSQTKCFAKPSTSCNNIKTNNTTNLIVDSDLILTSLDNKMKRKNVAASTTNTKVPHILTNKRLMRTNSQDTDNSQNTTTSSNTTSSNEFIRLPPILLPIIKKMEQKSSDTSSTSVKLSESLSSVGPNIDSSVSSLDSDENESDAVGTTCNSSSDDDDELDLEVEEAIQKIEEIPVRETETASSISSSTIAPAMDLAATAKTNKEVVDRPSRSATNTRICQKWHGRASTAKTKRQQAQSPTSMLQVKDREQGGDYLIEISGRYLNIYGQCALRFIDKPWSLSKANDVNSVKFNYVNFNGITTILNKLKLRFRNIDHFYFKETNIHCLGQLNGLAEVQGLSSLYIDVDGNPIMQKNWRSYAIYRLYHWGLNVINDEPVTDEEVKKANEEFQGLSDLVLWSLPDILLQPLLVRLRLDTSYGISEKNVKKWLLTADPDLKSVVSKEALQWKKTTTSAQEEQVLRQKAKHYIAQLLDEMANSVNKLRLLDEKWPTILHEFVRNALLDYAQLDMYMKRKMLELLK